MSLLLSSLWPIAMLTGLFVAAVYLVRYILHRFVSIK